MQQQLPLIWGTEYKKDVDSSTQSVANPWEHVQHWYCESLKKNLLL